MKVESQYLTLKKLLDGDNTFTIPEFQRPFSWEPKQIDEFWADLVDVPESGHFLGPMVFCVEDDGTRSVVDGQQRLTAIQLVLALIRDEYTRLGDPVRESSMKRYSEVVNGFIMNGSYNVGTKLRTSDAQRVVLEDFMLLPLASEKRKNLKTAKDYKSLTVRERNLTKPLRKGYERLQEQLGQRLAALESDESRIAELDRLEQSLMRGVSVVTLEVTDLGDAYNLFESLNDKGLRLSAADLLKSHLLGRLKNSLDEEEVDDLLARWDEVVEGLGGGDITAFLRHYLLARVSGRVRKEDVFPRFKQLVKDNGAQATLDSVLSDGKVYAPLLDPAPADNGYELLLRLKGIGVDSQRVALLAARRYAPDKFGVVGELVEAMSFRWTVCGKNAQDLENFYQMIAAELRTHQLDAIPAIKAAFRESLPSDTVFSSSFLTQSPSKSLARYALRRFEEVLYPSEKVLLPAAQVHVEHVMPQTSTTFWRSQVASDTDYSDIVSKWGNLTLLRARLNQSIRNSDWATKRSQGYSGSDVHLTKSLLGFEAWTDEVVDLRTRWLSYLAPSVWGGKIETSAPQTRFENVFENPALIDN